MLQAATILRDLGFVLYAGSMFAFALLVLFSGHIQHLAREHVIRVYRAWGPGLGLSMGGLVLGALAVHYLKAGRFSWSWSDGAHQLDLAAWLVFFVVWANNCRVEVWTLDPLRKLDKDGQISDRARYDAEASGLGWNLLVQALMCIAVLVLRSLADSALGW